MILRVFHIIHTKPTHFLAPLFVSFLCPCNLPPPKENKKIKLINKWAHKFRASSPSPSQWRSGTHSPTCSSQRWVEPTCCKGGTRPPQHRAWTSTWPQVAAQTKDIHNVFGGNKGLKGQHRSSSNRTMDPDMALTAACAQMSPWPQRAVQANRSIWSLESTCPQTSSWSQAASQTLIPRWPSVATQVTAISTDTYCGNAMDPDMNLASSPGPDITMTPGGRAGSSDLPVPITTESLVLPLSTGHRSLSFIFSPISITRVPSFPSLHHTFSHRSGPGKALDVSLSCKSLRAMGFIFPLKNDIQ